MKSIGFILLITLTALLLSGCATGSSSEGASATTISGYVDTSLGYQAK